MTIMNEILSQMLALLLGVSLGAMFYGGLWWTVRKVVSSQRPARWIFGSLLVRTGIALTGFYFILRNHWGRLPVCLLGFIITRMLVTRLAWAPEKPVPARQEAGHAPYPG